MKQAYRYTAAHRFSHRWAVALIGKMGMRGAARPKLKIQLICGGFQVIRFVFVNFKNKLNT